MTARLLGTWSIGLTAAVVAAAILSQLSFATAQSSDNALPRREDSAEAVYRRVFVPADRPDEWPTGGKRYLPINRDQFEKSAAAASQRRALGQEQVVQIASARYSARLEQNSLVGELTFQLRLIDEMPSILSLARLNLAISQPQWGGEGDEEALVGLWNRSAEQASTPGVLVERSGQLTATWTARQELASSSGREFRLRLPPALKQEFVLELPSDYIASMSPLSPVDIDSVDGSSLRQWAFKLAPANEHILRITPPASEGPRQSTLTLVAVSESYAVTPRSVEYEAEFRVQRRTVEQTEFSVGVPEGLRITEALVDGKAVNWAVHQDDATKVSIKLSPSIGVVDAKFLAVGPVVLSDSWKLPRIVSRQAFDTEGATTLWIDPALELQSIAPQSATLVNQVGVGAPSGGEAYRLQHLSSDATAEVIIAERTAQLRAETGTVAEFADRELAGRCNARVWATGGSLFHIQAALAAEWELEAVEATPPETLVEWHVAGAGRDRRLHLQLRRTPTDQEPLSLAIAARKPLRGWAPTATLGELAWIRFLGADEDGGPLLVADRRSGELTASRQALSAVRTLSSLSARERQLLGEPTRGMVFSPSEAPPEATVKVTASAPRFQAEAWIELTRAEAGFQHQAQILCRPQGAISLLTVATARPLPADAQWTLVSTGEQLSVERTNGGVQNAAPPESGVTAYRVRLPTAQSDPFGLRITWYGEGAAQESVVGIAMPEADNWNAWALLRGKPALVRVNPNGVPAASVIPQDQAADEPPIVGCFRLGDDPSTPAAVSPSLAASPSPTALGADGVTCWECDVTTLQFLDGRQSHRIVYDLESVDAGSCLLEAPKGLQIVSARLDEQVIASLAELKASRRLNVPLATHGKRHRLVIDLQGTRARLNATTRLVFTLPRTSFDIARARWTLCAPAPYAVSTAATRDAAGWRQRLFGPLVDTPGDEPTPLGANAPRGATEGNTNAAHSPSEAFVPARWSKASQMFVTTPAPMEIQRLDESRAAWHAAWLVAAVLAGFFWLISPRWLAAGALAAAVACLVLPLSYIAIPQAIFLGTLAGAIVRELLARTAKPGVGARSQAMSRAAMLTLACFVSVATVSRAGDEVPSPAVLYPIDERGEREGDDVYVPADLLNELLPSTLQSRYDGATSLLRSADYLIELSDGADGTVACEAASLRFSVQTFRRAVHVSLPLARRQAQWIETGHTLDGQAVKLSWNSSGIGCSLLVPEPGVHELVLRLKPQATADGARSYVSVSVPPMPSAIVEVNHPAGLSELAINSTKLVADAAQSTHAMLTIPASNRLEASWPSRMKRPSMDLTIDQLSWLKIAPAGVQLEVRFRLTGDLWSLETLELNTPPQLKLITPPRESPFVQVSGESSSPGITKLRLTAPAQAPLNASLQFQLQRSVALGSIEFPIVAPAIAANSNRQFAVSVDSRLRVSNVSSGDLTSTPVAEVERLWGPLESVPASAYSATGQAPHWSMQVAPATEQLVSREAMELLVSADHAAVSYTAAIESAASGALVHRLQLPPELHVAAVAVESDDGKETLRWSRPRPEELNVFLDQPISGPHRLLLQGELPHDGRRITVPQLRLERSTAGPLTVTVLRDSGVLVEQVGGDALTPSLPVTRGESPHSLSVGQYTVAREADAGPHFRISPNDAQLETNTVVTIDLAGPKPIANIAVHGRVARGVVNRVRLSVSNNLSESATADSSVQALSKPAPGNPERQVIEATLPKVASAGEEFVLKLTGELTLGTDQRLRFPQLRVLDAPTQELFLLLPKAPSGQTAEWTLRRLQQANLPESLAEALEIPASTPAYRAQGDRFVAEQRVFPVALRTATVRLADTHVTIDSRGDWSAVTELIIQPGGGGDISLSIPARAKLLHAAVDEHSIPVTAEATAVHVPAGSRYLPRIVSVAYQRESDGRRRAELETPQVRVDGKPLAIGRVLWSIGGERADLLAVAGPGAALNLEAHRRAVRRENLSTALEASTLALQLPEWELHNWFQPWLRRLEPAGVPGAAAAKDPDEEAWSELRQRITAAKPSSGESKLTARPDAERDGGSAAAWYRGGPEGKLTLAPARRGIGAGRWLLAMALAAAGAGVWRYPRYYEQALDWIRPWQGAIGIAVGVAWWWMLTPSLLGPVIIALSLAALIKTRTGLPTIEPAALLRN